MKFDELVILLEYTENQIDAVRVMADSYEGYINDFVSRFSFMVDPAFLEKAKEKLNGLDIDLYDSSGGAIDDDELEEDYEKIQEYEDTVMEEIIRVANNIAINKFKCTLEVGIDGGQGDGALIIINSRPLDDTNIVFKGGVYYHLTKYNNIENIKRKGIIAKSARDFYVNYTPSVFLFKELPSDEEIKEMGQLYQGKPGGTISGAYSDYKGDIAVFRVNLPKSFKIKKDTDTKDGYFTNKSIPAKFVEFVKTV